MDSQTTPLSGPSANTASVHRRPRVLSPALLAGFIVIVIVLVVTLVADLANLRNVYTTNEVVTHTHAIRAGLEGILTRMVDAETGERGFIITGEPGYLEPYNRSRAVIVAELARVRELVGDDPDQQADFDRLSAAADVRLQEMNATVRARRELGLAAAQAMVATNIEKRTMDGLRAIVDRMEGREDALTAKRTAEAAQSYQTARFTAVVTTIVALLALIGLFVAVKRYGDERVRAARAAEEQATRLREALQQKDDFVALVSHELRTPTNTIAGWARMLDEGTIRPDRSANAIGAVRRNAETLRQLLDDLMDTTQLVTGRMRLVEEVVDLRLVVLDAIDAVRLSAENKGVVLTDDLPLDVPSVRGDPVRLKQIVWNLLSNAIKFTPTGGQVSIALMATDGLRVEVRDSGAGIHPDFLPHVFERYRQASVATSAQRGVGLGLAIVRHLVELHGGTVSAYSAGLGRGAIFIINLPAISEPGLRSTGLSLEQAALRR
jgi:signal transduction histidine kinase